MVREGRSFREAVRAANRGKAARRHFSEELRAEAVSITRAARRQGSSWKEILEGLGVGAALLQKWCRETPSSFVRVEMSEATPKVVREGLRLQTPEGFAIEGLDVAGAIELLRQLR